jgi:hypothetical protein
MYRIHPFLIPSSVAGAGMCVCVCVCVCACVCVCVYVCCVCVCVCVCVLCVCMCVCVCAHTHILTRPRSISTHGNQYSIYTYLTSKIFHFSTYLFSTYLQPYSISGLCVGGGGWGGVTVRDGRHSVTFHAHAKLANRKLN